jgi:hypothetical protein
VGRTVRPYQVDRLPVRADRPSVRADHPRGSKEHGEVLDALEVISDRPRWGPEPSARRC